MPHFSVFNRKSSGFGLLKLVICLALFSHSATAYFEVDEKASEVMNGIRLRDYADFFKKWKMVTVRYREDTKEMRITYANAKAGAGLRALRPDYPDGTVFGKVGIATEADPGFPSSRLPAGKKRFQLMVRDKKKYKDTDGWGYALFDESGKVFSGDEKINTAACVACHRLVPERDFVFSRALNIGGPILPMAQSKGASATLYFSPKNKNDFTGPAADLWQPGEGAGESLEGELQKKAFSGTLDEVMPLLLERAKKLSRSAILFVDANNFSLAQKLTKNSCGAEGLLSFRVVIYSNGKMVRDAELCY